MTYDSSRVNPQPIVHFGYENVQSAPGRRLGASVSWRPVGGSFDQLVEIPAGVGGLPTAPTFQHYWSIPANGNFEAALQADMRNAPSGHYNVELKSGLVQYIDGEAFGVSNSALVPVEIVNTTSSAFGAGWGLGGLTELVLNPDGSVLMVDGDGSELLFEAAGAGSFTSPAGDFSTLERVDEGNGLIYRRTYKDQSVDRYRNLAAPSSRSAPQVVAQIESMTDRNGNETRFEYDAQSRLSRIIDPAGLATVLNYANGKIASLVDPAGRVTVFEHDAAGNLIRIGDPDDSQRQFEYNQNHKLTAELTKRGFREEAHYDSFGRVTKTVRRDRTEFQIAPLQTQQMIRYSLTTDHTVPPAAPNRKVFVDSVAIGSISADYAPPANSVGEARWLDPSGRVFRTLVDQEGQSVLRSDSEGLVASNSRSEANQIVRSVSGRGFVTLYEYDARGNLLSVTDDETLSDASAEYLFDRGFDTAGDIRESDGGVSLDTDTYLPGANAAGLSLVSDSVFGEQRTVLQFTTDHGVALETSGVIPSDHYSIEIVFRLDDVSGNNHIIDFKDQAGGAPPLEVVDGEVGIGILGAPRGGLMVDGAYSHVVLTRTAETGQVVGYVDGAEAFRFLDTGVNFTVSSAGVLKFFVPFLSFYNQGFTSSGAIALLRAYANPLTLGQVKRLSDDPFGADFSGFDKTVFTYDATFNQRTSMTDQLGHQTLYEVDPNNGNLLSVSQVMGQADSQSSETDDVVTRYTYLASGLVDTMTDPLGRVT
ncbi:MAG: hypothetical protein ABI614_18940, partial [Planctomycetota bacterium]